MVVVSCLLLLFGPPVLKPHPHSPLRESQCVCESVAGLEIGDHPLLKGCLEDRQLSGCHLLARLLDPLLPVDPHASIGSQRHHDEGSMRLRSLGQKVCDRLLLLKGDGVDSNFEGRIRWSLVLYLTGGSSSRGWG